MRRGVKISLEGIDGVGKTTQTDVARDYLERRGHDVFFKPCRNNLYSQGLDNDIATILKSSKEVLDKVPAAEVLMNAARTMYLHNAHIKDHLAKGGVVLCDRDVDTALAYSMPSLRRQYPEMSAGRLTEWMLGVYAIESTVPDLTILLDADTSVALGRAMSDEVPNERAVFDEGGVAFMEEVQENYRQLSDMFPERITRIDVNERSIDEVSGQLLHTIGTFLGERMGE